MLQLHRKREVLNFRVDEKMNEVVIIVEGGVSCENEQKIMREREKT